MTGSDGNESGEEVSIEIAIGGQRTLKGSRKRIGCCTEENELIFKGWSDERLYIE